MMWLHWSARESLLKCIKDLIHKVLFLHACSQFELYYFWHFSLFFNFNELFLSLSFRVMVFLISIKKRIYFPETNFILYQKISWISFSVFFSVITLSLANLFIYTCTSHGMPYMPHAMKVFSSLFHQ